MALISRDITVDWGVTGLVGTLSVNVVDSDDQDLIAATTAGIVEFPAASGIYHLKVTNWNTTWVGKVIWRDGQAGIGHFASESFDAQSGNVVVNTPSEVFDLREEETSISD